MIQTCCHVSISQLQQYFLKFVLTILLRNFWILKVRTSLTCISLYDYWSILNQYQYLVMKRLVTLKDMLHVKDLDHHLHKHRTGHWMEKSHKLAANFYHLSQVKQSRTIQHHMGYFDCSAAIPWIFLRYIQVHVVYSNH